MGSEKWWVCVLYAINAPALRRLSHFNTMGGWKGRVANTLSCFCFGRFHDFLIYEKRPARERRGKCGRLSKSSG